MTKSHCKELLIKRGRVSSECDEDSVEAAIYDKAACIYKSFGPSRMDLNEISISNRKTES